jgi:hypothetical protein
MGWAEGLTIAEAVSCRLTTAASRVRARVCHVGIVVANLDLRFPQNTSVSPANVHPTNCSTITIICNVGLVQ